MSRTLFWKRSAANKYIYCDNCISLTGLFLFYWGVYGNSMCFRAGFRRMCLKHNVSTSASNGWQLDVRFKHKVSIRFSGTDNTASQIQSTKSHTQSTHTCSQRTVNTVLHTVNAPLHTTSVLFVSLRVIWEVGVLRHIVVGEWSFPAPRNICHRTPTSPTTTANKIIFWGKREYSKERMSTGVLTSYVEFFSRIEYQMPTFRCMRMIIRSL